MTRKNNNHICTTTQWHFIDNFTTHYLSVTKCNQNNIFLFNIFGEFPPPPVMCLVTYGLFYLLNIFVINAVALKLPNKLFSFNILIFLRNKEMTINVSFLTYSTFFLHFEVEVYPKNLLFYCYSSLSGNNSFLACTLFYTCSLIT